MSQDRRRTQREGVTHSKVHSSFNTSQDRPQTRKKASLSQECTRPSKIEGGRIGVQVGRGYLRSSQKGKDKTQQTGADRARIHRRVVCRRFRQTPHRLLRTISTPASVGAHNAPRSLPPKHSAAGMCATPPTLPPSETLCRRGAHNGPCSLLPKQSPANVRATPPAFLCPEHFATNVGARAGGGGWGTQPKVVDSSINLNGHRRQNGRMAIGEQRDYKRMSEEIATHSTRRSR
jgi:hypothetical protein